MWAVVHVGSSVIGSNCSYTILCPRRYLLITRSAATSLSLHSPDLQSARHANTGCLSRTRSQRQIKTIRRKRIKERPCPSKDPQMDQIVKSTKEKYKTKKMKFSGGMTRMRDNRPDSNWGVETSGDKIPFPNRRFTLYRQFEQNEREIITNI